MRLELHCHSTCSDGSYPATEVAERADAFGVELFCLTDHDTFAGYEDTARVFAGTRTRVLRGMELSCKENNRTVHLLLYDLQEGPGLDVMRVRVGELLKTRQARIHTICDRLRTLGVDLDATSILRSTHGVPGRPAVAAALVRAKICTSRREAFDRFLKDGGPADVSVDRITLAEGIELGRAAGAKPSIAHPHTFGRWDLAKEVCKRYRDQGLDGLEAYYGRYGKAETEGWLRLADELDMVATGGSDFHGEMSPGVSRPGITLPAGRADAIVRWLAS